MRSTLLAAAGFVGCCQWDKSCCACHIAHESSSSDKDLVISLAVDRAGVQIRGALIVRE